MELRKMFLVINGVERIIDCDPERETLADVLRRIGLTGTKVGCRTGQCGICNVILDGKLVRSCIRKMKTIPDRASVTTIEGIGQPGHLHPLQQAFIYHGAVQCGFCSAGFIVSAKALLDQNPNPTRAEVRDWFTRNRNACRCTGYKQIVDAVMSAAKVLRGELTMEDITYQPPKDGSVYGTNVPRPAALAKVTGLCDYGDDLGLKMPEGTLHLALVLSGTVHGILNGIDFSEAEKMPGVVKVITAADVKGTNYLSLEIAHPNSKFKGRDHAILATGKVRRVGDVVAIVAADTREHARAAAKAVRLDITPLPGYLTLPEALAPDAVELEPGVPNNFLTAPLMKGEDTREILDESEYVVEGSFHSQSQPHLALEPDCGQAFLDGEGNLTIQYKTHGLELTRSAIAAGIGLPVDKIRVIMPPTGGTFGYSFCTLFPALLGVAALAVERPVTITLSYAEQCLVSGKRLSAYTNARLGCDREGKLTGMEFDYACNIGAYSDVGDVYFWRPMLWAGFGYNVPNARALLRCCMSNQTIGIAYRGSGSVQTYTFSEALMDMLAQKAGIDPFDFRYRNLAKPGETGLYSYPYKQYVFFDLMDALKPDYDAARARQKELSTAEKKRGVSITLCGFNVGDPNDHCEVALELNPDNTVTFYNQWEDMGQGADTGSIVIAHEALRALKLDWKDIRLVMNDTRDCPPTGFSASNRQHYMVSGATKNAADQLLGAMRKPDGSFRTYAEMKAEGIPTKYLGIFDTAQWTVMTDPKTGHGDPISEYNYCALVTEVEVEPATGKTKVLRMSLAYDIGTVGSPAVVDGQAYGSLMHGIGMALREQYIDDGTYTTLAKCGFTYANDMPDDITLIDCPSKHEHAAFGGVGCCEGFQSIPHIGVVNAIADACGARVYELPATPDKVKAALAAKEQGCDQPEPYYLGSDFYDTLDDLLEDVEV